MDIIDGKLIFTTANENRTTSTTESFSLDNRHGVNPQGSSFSPLAAPFQSRVHTAGNDFISTPTQQEPMIADTAPASAGIEDVLKNLYINNDMLFNEIDYSTYLNGNKAEVTPGSNSTVWNEGIDSRQTEMIDTFDFLIKSLSAANYYVTSLSREESSVLHEMRPSVLYKFLSEVARVQNEKRMRRALPNECAFCKNNGENEENYSSHALKDWRGRVLCPVLRAFRCPRCGATGDRAHTIKYCPENFDTSLQRTGSLLSRRRGSSSLSLGGTRGVGSSAPATPAPSPNVTNTPFTTIWSTFGMN